MKEEQKGMAEKKRLNSNLSESVLFLKVDTK